MLNCFTPDTLAVGARERGCLMCRHLDTQSLSPIATDTRLPSFGSDIHEMKRLLTLLLVCSLLPVGQVLAADLDAPYTPTRAEWLRSYLAENIQIDTDSWALRVRVMVTVVNKTQQVLITLKPANGEKKPTQEERDFYVKSVTDIVKHALERYPWSKDLNVKVMFV